MAANSNNDKVFVEDIKDGDRVKTVFLVKSKAVPVSKTGKPYINLTLCDRTGELDAKVWEKAREIDKLFSKNDFVAVEGVANLYQGRLQLRVDGVARVDDAKVNIADFLRVTHADVEAMWQEVLKALKSVRNPDLKKLVSAFVRDEALVKGFKRAPAAKEIHHAFIGGLLEHTLSMIRLAERICQYYPLVDRDLTVVGCFVHDIGKTRELFYERAFDYTDAGRLVGHIVMGVEILGAKAAEAGGVSEAVEMHLKHIILSHHTELEFGSPKRPKTPEALLVGLLDDLDAKMNHWKAIFEREPGDAWTTFQKHYDRYLFKGRPYVPGGPDEETERAGPPGKGDLRYKPFAQMPLLGGKTEGGGR
ncbi:MAG: HD domain-containing protein [Deltaproteobacteria bacterium]|nr:HD domain-containing protein [Deltaproteobacteria bacterium]